MEILNIKGVSFPVAKYKILRVYHYGDNYEDEFYAPADMRFFKYDDYGHQIKYKKQNITQQFWIGITEWSEEKERISHNMHYCYKDIDDEEDDYPVVNSMSVYVHNICNKYLIWELKDIGIIEGEEFPSIDKPETFKEPVYLVKKSKSEDADDGLYLALAELSKSGKEITEDNIKELKNKIHKPYQYVKINGITEDGCGYDATTVTINSWLYYNNIPSNIIERGKILFDDIPEFDKFTEVEECTKEEFDDIFDKTLKAIKD